MNEEMNSEENNEKNMNNSGCDSTSQVPLLSREFILTLDRKLDEKLAFLEAEVERITTSNASLEDNIKTKYAKVKETKKEINASKKRITNLEKTRDDVRKSAKELAEYAQLLKTNLEKYEEENIALERKHRESIKDLKTKWNIYQTQYEALPLAIERNRQQVVLQKARIELMVKQYKRAELKKILAKQEEIETKRRNNLAVECARLYKEAKIEDVEMRVVMETQKNLQEILRQQEKTILELENKQKEQTVVSQQSVIGKSEKRGIVSLLSRSQKYIFGQNTRFDLSALSGTLTQPMPPFRRDNYDTISITSSVIDNLIETGNLQLPVTDINEYCPSQAQDHHNDDQTTKAAFYMDLNKKDLDVEENHPVPSENEQKLKPTSNLRFEDMENENEQAPQRFESETIINQPADVQDTEEHNSLKAVAEDVNPRVSKYCEYAEEKEEGVEIAEPDYSIASNQVPMKKKSGCSSFLPGAQIKRPRITNIENVQLNLPPNTATTPKTARDDSLAKHFTTSAASSIDYNWKLENRPTNLHFSFTDSQRGDPEFESILDSEISMQSENLKKFHMSFSPDRQGISENDNRNENQYLTPQANLPAQRSSQINKPQPTLQFLDMRNRETQPSQGNKKDEFFLSMF